MYRLMIVDDEPIIREGLCTMIPWEVLGFTVTTTAETGLEALSLFRASPVDAILMDINMPEMSGLEMIQNIRQMNAETKVVIISGYSEFEYAREAIKLHVEDYLLKPIDPDHIYAVFSKIKETLDEEREQRLVEKINAFSPSSYEPLKIFCGKLVASIEQAKVKELRGEAQRFLEQIEKLSVVDGAACCRYALQYMSAQFGGMPNEILSGECLPEKEIENFLYNIEQAAEIIGKNAAQMTLVLCKRAKVAIDEHYMEKTFSLKDVAASLNISYGYLSASFSKHYKIGLKTYLIQKRMEKARQLLMERKLKMYEIADAVGYSTSPYFSDAFRKYYGMFPSQYLASIGKNAESPDDEEMA